MKKAFLSLVAGLLQVACGSNDRGAAIPFTLDAFERIAVSDAAGTVYRNDSLLLGDPQAIRYHPDGYLVLLDRPNTGQVVVIDLETDSVQHLIKRGRGPEEIISVRDLAIRDGAIWVSGLADRKIMKLNAPKVAGRSTPNWYVRRRISLCGQFPFPESGSLRWPPHRPGTGFIGSTVKV